MKVSKSMVRILQKAIEMRILPERAAVMLGLRVRVWTLSKVDRTAWSYCTRYVMEAWRDESR